jgi:putative hydrolase of the HAD superfamily
LKKYTHIFFDLDHTLWDYNANATETIHDLMERYGLINEYGAERETFLEEFFVVNDELWSRFNQGLVDKEYIRTKRFQIVLENLKINDFDKVEGLQEDFIAECPTKGKLIPGAGEIVRKLSKSYRLYIITNGFDGIQHTKVKYCGLEEYFEDIITSERAQVQKPDPTIFHFAMDLATVDKSCSLMIGDNIGSDIIGAISAGIDQVYFNPDNRVNGVKPTYEITHLDQLEDILL